MMGATAGSYGSMNGSGLMSRRTLSDPRSPGTLPPSSPVEYDDCVRKPTRLEALAVTGKPSRKKASRSQNGC